MLLLISIVLSFVVELHMMQYFHIEIQWVSGRRELRLPWVSQRQSSDRAQAHSTPVQGTEDRQEVTGRRRREVSLPFSD